MRPSLIALLLVLGLAACGSSDAADDDTTDQAGEDAPSADAAAGSDITDPEPADADTTAATEAPAGGEPDEVDDGPAVPGPGDAVGTLTGPDLDILVVGACDYDVSDLTSADIAFADVRGVDPAGVEWPVRFGLSGSPDRNTQLNVNGTQVVVRWPEPGLLEQATDDGSYRLDTTLGRLVVSAADGYELNISCSER